MGLFTKSSVEKTMKESFTNYHTQEQLTKFIEENWDILNLKVTFDDFQKKELSEEKILQLISSNNFVSLYYQIRKILTQKYKVSENDIDVLIQKGIDNEKSRISLSDEDFRSFQKFLQNRESEKEQKNIELAETLERLKNSLKDLDKWD